MPRPLKVSAKEAARLEAAFGSQQVRTDVPVPQPDSMASYRADRKLNPSEYEKDPTGFAAVHHLAQAVPCRRCGRQVVELVQCYGAGPCSLGEPVCTACGQLEKQAGRKPKARKQTGSRSTRAGTDLL